MHEHNNNNTSSVHDVAISLNPCARYSSMTNLDMLLLKGPPHDNLEAGLDELRYTILTEGVPANNEGMVGCAVNEHTCQPIDTFIRQLR